MKLNLPFFNRERYVLLSAYTPVECLNEYAPICLSSKAVPEFPRTAKQEMGFKTCHGFIASLKRSATIFAPCDFDVRSNADAFQYSWPNQTHFTVADHSDPQFDSSRSFVTKLGLPFAVRCNKKDVNFVTASHILNDTQMRIPSGVTPFLYGVKLNIFNYVPKVEAEYSVPFRKPIVALYPLSDLPFHVECSFDPVKYQHYVESCYNRPKYKNFSFTLSHMNTIK